MNHMLNFLKSDFSRQRNHRNWNVNNSSWLLIWRSWQGTSFNFFRRWRALHSFVNIFLLREEERNAFDFEPRIWWNKNNFISNAIEYSSSIILKAGFELKFNYLEVSQTLDQTAEYTSQLGFIYIALGIYILRKFQGFKVFWFALWILFCERNCISCCCC